MTAITIDWILIAIVLLSMLLGFVRGFLVTLLATIVWAIAVFIAISYHGLFTSWLSHIPVVKDQASIVAAVLSIVVIFIVGSVIIRLIKLIPNGGSVSISSRLLAALVAIVRGGLLVIALVFILNMSPLNKENYWNNAQLVKYTNGYIYKISNIKVAALSKSKSAKPQAEHAKAEKKSK